MGITPLSPRIGSNLLVIVAASGDAVGGVEVFAAGGNLCRTRADGWKPGDRRFNPVSPTTEETGEGLGRGDRLWDRGFWWAVARSAHCAPGGDSGRTAHETAHAGGCGRPLELALLRWR